MGKHFDDVDVALEKEVVEEKKKEEKAVDNNGKEFAAKVDSLARLCRKEVSRLDQRVDGLDKDLEELQNFAKDSLQGSAELDQKIVELQKTIESVEKRVGKQAEKIAELEKLIASQPAPEPVVVQPDLSDIYDRLSKLEEGGWVKNELCMITGRLTALENAQGKFGSEEQHPAPEPAVEKKPTTYEKANPKGPQPKEIRTFYVCTVGDYNITQESEELAAELANTLEPGKEHKITRIAAWIDDKGNYVRSLNAVELQNLGLIK